MKPLLFALLCLLSVPASGAPCVAPPAGLVSWWRAEGDGFDRAGANHGMVTGGVTFAAGQVGQAFNFPVGSPVVAVPASASLDVGALAGYTLEGWINPANATTQMPIAEWNSAGNPAAHFWISVSYAGFGGPGSIYASLHGGIPGIFATGPGIIQAGVWQHVAMTWDKTSGAARLYRNGTLVASTNLSGQVPVTTPNLYLGNRPGSSSFQGQLDELALYSRALSAEELLAIYNAGAAGKCPPGPPPPNGPGYALNLDGANDYLSAVPAGLPLANSAYTIEAWIRPDLMHVGAVAAWGDYAPNLANAFVLDVDGLVNYWWGNDLKLLTTNLAGAWHHVAATFDGTTRRILLDGVALTNDTPVGHATTASNFRIGRANLGQYFDGLMDEIRVWNVARTTNEIQAAMRRQLWGNEPGLVGCWRFDEGAGVNAFDATGNAANTATLANGPVWATSFLSPFVPDITTAGVDELLPRSVRLTGLVDANGAASTVYFEWGATTNYGNVTTGFTADGMTVGYWRSTLTNLTPGLTYHFRAVATNSLGASYGRNENFTMPAFFTVTTTASSGPGSLDEAINAAASGDRIVIPPEVTGSIFSDPGPVFGDGFAINKDLTIEGPGAHLLTLTGNQVARVCTITGGRVRISGVTIAQGWALGTAGAAGVTGFGGLGGPGVGGGILNLGDLTLFECMVNDNLAGGGTGGLGGRDPSDAFSGYTGGTGGTAFGGGICNSNRLTLLNCTFFTNRCNGGLGGRGSDGNQQSGGFGGTGGAGGMGQGGAIFNAGWLTATNCTFFTNQVSGGSGGTGGRAVGAPGSNGGNGGNGLGGAIVDAGTSAIVSCTIAGSRASGGIGGLAGPSGTGGGGENGTSGAGSNGGLAQGVASGYQTFLRNTLVAGNSATTARDLGGIYVSAGFNLIGVTGDGQVTTGFTNATDQLGTVGAPINPFFRPLGGYGGTTWVLPVLTNSPATDKGHSSGVPRDQRGFVRPADVAEAGNGAGDGADIGAFELERGAVYIVTNTLPGNVPGSLWWAISNANLTADADTIAFNIPGAGPHTISLTVELPPITRPVTIDGYTQPGASPNTLPVGNDAVLQVELRATLFSHLTGLGLYGGDSIVRGLAINGFFLSAVDVGSSNNVIAGNFLGVNPAGDAAASVVFVPNGAGVTVHDSRFSLVGGPAPADRNVISANQMGIVIRQPAAVSNRVEGNYIGVNAAGSAPLGNTNEGVWIADAPANTIGGTNGTAGNVIAGNARAGVLISELSATQNIVMGNYVGTDATGGARMANGTEGIRIENAPSNTISACVIAANPGHGVLALSSPGTHIRGSRIGNGPGLPAVPLNNSGHGIFVVDSPFTQITDGNVIGPNSGDGVRLVGATTHDCVVDQNYIGIDRDGVTALGNGSAGVGIFDASNNQIGGTNAGSNWIVYNAAGGVTVAGVRATNNAVRANSIHSNGGLGIDLDASGISADGPTANDPGDGDAGPNRLQNFPVLAFAVPSASTVISGSLTSTPSTTFRLEFFANNAADPSGYGEGETFIGATNVTTEAGGAVPFTFVSTYTASPGQFITATATDPNGNTSEFSPALRVSDPNAPVIRVNGQVVMGTVTVTNSAVVSLEGGFSNGLIFYTTDGSDPTVGLFYSAPFVVQQTATLRALAFDVEFGVEAEAAPVVVNVIVQRAPQIFRPPVDVVQPDGGLAVFNVGADGAPPLAFHWRRNGAPLLNETNAALVLTNLQPAQAGNFEVVITNAFGAVTSAVAVLAVVPRPGLAVQPMNTTVAAGGRVVLSVVATGVGPFSYQWRKTGVNIPGATSDMLVIDPALLTDSGTYDVVVINAAGAVTSDPAELIVTTNAVVGGDSFAGRIPLGSVAAGSISGTNTGATLEGGEPAHGGKRGSNSIWFKWTAPASGVAEFQTSGSSFDTLLGVYTGTIVDALTLVARGEDNGDYLSSRARFYAAAGVEYAIAVDGFAGGQGRFVLGWQFTATNNPLPVITSAPPAFRTVTPGADVVFAVGANAGGAPLDYQWHFNLQPLDGATNPVLTLLAAQPENVGYYQLAITNRNTRQGVESEFFSLEMGTQTNAHSADKFEDLFVAPGGGGGGGLAPARKLSSLTGGSPGGSFLIRPGDVDSHFLNNRLAATQLNASNACGQTSHDLNLSITSAVTATCFVNTYGSDIATVLVVYNADAQGEVLVGQVVACSTGGGISGGATVVFTADAGQNYVFRVDGANGATGLIRLNWGVSAQALESSGPGVARVRRGSTYTFNLGTAPPAPYTFAWRHNGTNIPGAFTDRLTLTNLQAADAGRYEIVMINSGSGGIVGTHLVGLLEVDTTTLALAYSTFDKGREGWTNRGGGTALSFSTDGGNPDGRISAQSVSTSSGLWYWVAPARFLGNQRAAYGGFLEFNLRQSTSNAPLADTPLLVLHSGDKTLSFLSTRTPGINWTPYKVPLVETHPKWTTRETQGDFIGVLQNLTGIEIRGRFSSETNTVSLDNVVLVGLCTNEPGALIVRRLPGAICLEWPVLPACLELEATTNLSAPVWQVIPIAPPSRGVNEIIVQTTEPQRFFRLRHP